jgi:6-pyruvoyl-tetrahydropterin synthase
MVMDFGELSKVLDELLGPYDHKHIGIIPEGWSSNPEHVMNVPFKNTTAENLAKFWGEAIQKKISPVKLVEINVFETPRSKATWNPG